MFGDVTSALCGGPESQLVWVETLVLIAVKHAPVQSSRPRSAALSLFPFSLLIQNKVHRGNRFVL